MTQVILNQGIADYSNNIHSTFTVQYLVVVVVVVVVLSQKLS